MHLHILSIGGTFMSALALLAREAGFTVTGSDANCYPPVSELLAAKQIHWTEGYEDNADVLRADCVVVGNAVKRGLPVMEAVLERRQPYISGPQWLAEHILPRYRVMAVAGTHGKTTTTSMLAYILDQAGLQPGFLIGGIASDFQTSARLGQGDWFIIEADEYDTAFFDKRPKFMHYHPDVAILNNLEFDHADIYANLPAIQQQFHYLLRTIRPSGLVIKPLQDVALNDVLQQGIYSQVEEITLHDANKAVWRAELLDEVGSAFRVYHLNKPITEVHWSLIGAFNVENALAALAASHYAGVKIETAAKALATFTPVKRRLEVKANRYGVTVYDDFAHHPTAIAKTIQALKQSARHQRIFAVMEFASYTMRTGVHLEAMAHALDGVDEAYVLSPREFSHANMTKAWRFPYHVLPETTAIIEKVVNQVQDGDAILVMSNRGFDNIHERLTQRIEERFASI